MTTAERTPQHVPLSRASTIPSRFYLDPAILEDEKERVFGRTWQLVARYEDLSRIGDFVPVTVLDEPVVITHGLDGELKAFYNVCRHRAGQVALSRGNRKSLQCRYHGWTYGLDGCLRAAPEMEATEGFAMEDFGLVPVQVDRWGPFVFVCLDDDAPPRAMTSSTCISSSDGTTSSSATGRSTSTTFSRATTSPSRTRSSSRSSTT